MYAGFLASNLVLGGQALVSLIPHVGATMGISSVCIVSVIAAIFGHDLIHAYARVTAYVSGAVLLLTFGWILWVHGLPSNFLARNTVSATGVLGAISTAALWQIAYAPYVSDYSRYLPHDTGARPAFWASYWGCTLGSLLPMILGAMVGLAAAGDDLIGNLAMLTRGIAPLALAMFCLGLATANAMNLYCAALSILTFGQTLWPRWTPQAPARTICVLILSALTFTAAVLAKKSFLESYTNFILLMLYVLVPWTAINLVDYYLLRHGAYDVASFLRHDGGLYGRINGVAVGCYLLGILVQLPFVATADYTGPIARALHGIDLSWMVGLAITAPAYYWLARWARPTVATLRWTPAP
jgi:nucleobase:cation symporter-1, NCS1 family